MQVTVNIPFSDLLALVKQLTPAQQAALQSELTNQPAKQTSKDRLKKLLLSGPALTDKQLETIEKTRNEINQWRTEF